MMTSLTWVPVVTEPLDLAAGKASHLNELVDLSIIGELTAGSLLGIWNLLLGLPVQLYNSMISGIL